MSKQTEEKKSTATGLHYHVSDLKNVDPLGLEQATCDLGMKQTVLDYMTPTERRHYENQNLCRKNGIRGHRNKCFGVGGERNRLKILAPPPPQQQHQPKRTLKDMAKDYFTTLETDYVVTDLNTVAIGANPTESFLQLTTEPTIETENDDHLYDTISGHYKKKAECKKQDAYYLDIIDDYSKPTFPSGSYDEIKCKTLSLSRHKNLPQNVYASTSWEFLNRTKGLMMSEFLSKLPATRSKRLVSICVVAMFLLCSIWLIAVASKPKHTNELIFPTQTHQRIGVTVYRPEVTIPEPTTSSLPVIIPNPECVTDCRGKIRAPLCASYRLTYFDYDSMCKFKNAKCQNPHLRKIGTGSCNQYKNSDEREDD